MASCRSGFNASPSTKHTGHHPSGEASLWTGHQGILSCKKLVIFTVRIRTDCPLTETTSSYGILSGQSILRSETSVCNSTLANHTLFVGLRGQVRAASSRSCNASTTRVKERSLSAVWITVNYPSMICERVWRTSRRTLSCSKERLDGILRLVPWIRHQ